jgi:hypothetical protein
VQKLFNKKEKKRKEEQFNLTNQHIMYKYKRFSVLAKDFATKSDVTDATSSLSTELTNVKGSVSTVVTKLNDVEYATNKSILETKEVLSTDLETVKNVLTADQLRTKAELEARIDQSATAEFVRNLETSFQAKIDQNVTDEDAKIDAISKAIIENGQVDINRDGLIAILTESIAEQGSKLVSDVAVITSKLEEFGDDFEYFVEDTKAGFSKLATVTV